MPSLSYLPNMSSTTSAATPTAWRSPMIGFSDENAAVTFSYRDRKNEDRKKTLTLTADEFIRRFLLHVIPKRFVRVRHFGFLANQSKGLLAKCRQLLDLDPTVPKLSQRSVHEWMLQLTGIDITLMPSMPKGNSALPCRPAPAVGFLVMIDRRIENRVVDPLCATAHAPARPVSLVHVLWPTLLCVSLSGRARSLRRRLTRFSQTTVVLLRLRPTSSFHSP